jgi:hypothetical protein
MRLSREASWPRKRAACLLLGGDEATCKRAEPMLKAVSKSIVHCGGVGHAAVLKIATNMLSAVTAQTLAEALALVTRAGLSPATFAAALEQNACRSGVVDLKLPKMVASDYEPHFSLKHMFKECSWRFIWPTHSSRGAGNDSHRGRHVWGLEQRLGGSRLCFGLQTLRKLFHNHSRGIGRPRGCRFRIGRGPLPLRRNPSRARTNRPCSSRLSEPRICR